MPSASYKGNQMNRNLRLKITMQKLLIVIVFLAIATGPRCSALTERHIQVPALKRIASLGDLYNANIDYIINVGVFRRQIPTEHISETQNPTKRTNAGILNSLENQFKLFDIDSNEAVNILTDITAARGAARILNQKKQSSQLRGTLTYKYQTVATRLWAFHEELKDLYNKDILGHIEATHVVTSITWGATVAVTLDGSSTETHDVRKTQSSLNKELRSLKGKVLPSDEINSNFSMSITSDVPLSNEIPTTAKEVKEILNQIPTIIAGINQGKGIPLQYTLTSINMIRKHMGVIVQNMTGHKINEFTLTKIIHAFQDLNLAEDQIYKMKEQLNGHANCVNPQTATNINGIISSFTIFKNNFTTTLKKSVVDVRLGLQENQVLSDLLEDFGNSEFCLENLNHRFVNLLSAIEKPNLCNAIQNEYSQIQYVGAGDDLITKLTTLQKSKKLVYVMFTNSEFISKQPETYTESFNLILENQEEEFNVCLFVDCDFVNYLCDDLNDTMVFEYVNGSFNPSIRHRDFVQNSKVLEMTNLWNFTVDQFQKQLDTQTNFQNVISGHLSVLENKLKCAGNPCYNGGKCLVTNTERQCECLTGFLGDNCETNIDNCAGHNSCLNGATCVDNTGGFSCACSLGFTGNYCEANIDDCAGHNSCLNGATCVDGIGNFICTCAPGFTGNYCETNIDDCAGHNSCLNGATCVDGIDSFICVCSDEYVGNHCEHKNECMHPGTCASVVRNAKCRCREGYAPDPQDSRRCEPVNKNINKNATLIFGSSSSSGGIEQFSLSQNTVTRIQSHGSMNRALDLLYRTNSMFWSDTSGKIYTAPIRPGAPKTVVLDEPGSSIQCLAVDWIFGHMYYAGSRKISVANLDGTMKKVLFTTGVTEVLSIVVDPLNGWMYWVDHTTDSIERAGMDGSQRKVLATLPGSVHPWGLALDMTQNRLYWTMHNNHPSAIHSMRPDGTDTKLVYQATQPIFTSSDFYSMTIFGDYVYWRDFATRAVYKTNKCGGGEVTAIHSFTNSGDAFHTLHAYHFSKQPEGVNYCENRIGGQCSYLCFPSPSTGNQAVTTKCACPDGRTLSFNQRTCT